VLTVFEAPALRLAMSDSMGKEGQEDYLNDLRTDARQSLAAFIARLGIQQARRPHPKSGCANDGNMLDKEFGKARSLL
jgi:hypothetical protein